MRFERKIQGYIVICFLILSSNLQGQESDTTKRKKNSFALFPALSFAPETSVQFGAAAIWVLGNEKQTNSKFERESTISPFFLYTFKNQIISAVNLNYFTSKGHNLNGSVRYFNFPDFYFGIGNDNDPDISESYTNIFFQLEGQYLKLLNATSFLGIAFDAQTNSIRDVETDGMLESDNVPGLEGGTLLAIGPTWRFDTRNNTIYPSSGYLVTVRSLFNHIGDFSFTSHLADFRKYISIGNEDNILALQLRANITTGTDIPFYKLPQLGGDERLRGISNASLYRDRQMVYTQVEYRRPLFWRLGFTVFAGVGDVAFNPGDFELSEFKYVGGIGGRFAAIPEKKLNIRGDIGVARGGQIAIYIGLSEAF